MNVKFILVMCVIATSCARSTAQQPSITLRKIDADASLVKKWTEEGRISEFERALGALEGQVADALRATQRFSVLGDNLDTTPDAPPGGRTRRPSEFYLSVTVTDFENSAATIIQGDSTVTRNAEAIAQQRELNMLDQQLRRLRGAQVQRRKVIITRMNYLRRSLTVTSRLDKGSVVGRAMFMGVRMRLSDGSDQDLRTGTASFKTNAHNQVLAQDVKAIAEREDLLRTATIALSRRVTTEIAEYITPATVLDKRPTDVTLSWGSDCGVLVGQSYSIYRRAGDLGPGARTSNPALDTPVGKVRIYRTERQFSTARIINDNGIATGCLARLELR